VQGPGRRWVNELIRETLAPYPAGLRIVSKVGGRRDDAGAWLPAQRSDELRAGVEENLVTLGVESLAAVNLRLMDPVAGGSAPSVPLAEQLGTVEDLRGEGKIEAINISSAARSVVEEALELVLACVQNAFSIMQRDALDVLELCSERDIAFVPRSIRWDRRSRAALSRSPPIRTSVASPRSTACRSHRSHSHGCCMSTGTFS